MSEHETIEPHPFVECRMTAHLFGGFEEVHCEDCHRPKDDAVHAVEEPDAPLGLAFALAILCVLFSFATDAQELRHGHLVDLPHLIDGDGQTITAQAHAFLAIKLPVVPWFVQIVDYTQQVDYLSTPQFTLPIGGLLARSIHTDQSTPDGWLILPVSKSCSPGETSTDVGYVTVCPPRAEGGSMDACTRSGGPEPLFAGVPEERVPCVVSRRRAVRR